MKKQEKNMGNFPTKVQLENFRIPKLRFSGFEGEWEYANLGNCAHSFEYGMNASAIKFDGENRYIRITDIDESSSKYKPEFPVSPNGQLLDKYLVSENDILFARTGASTGKSYLYHKDDGKLYFAGFLIRAKIKEEYNSYFVFAQTKTVQYYKWVQLMSMRSGQPGIKSQEYASYSFNIPSKNEQDKIASFFELLDERILTQKKIISQLKSQMSSLKDLIFEQRLRFKDEKGNNFPYWKDFRLSDLGNTFSGLSGKTKEHFGVGQKYIQYKQIFDSAKINISNCAFVDVAESENQNIVQYGDVFFTISSETPEEIGMSSVLLEYVDNVYLNSFCFGFRTNSLDELIPEFSQFLFRSNKFRNEIVKLAQGSTRYNMSKIEFLKLNVKLPCKDEQIKIANFLSSIQEKIETEKQILEKLELQKKFFFANLFV